METMTKAVTKPERARIPSEDYAAGGNRVGKLDRSQIPALGRDSSLTQCQTLKEAVVREANASKIQLDSPNGARATIVALIPPEVIVKVRGSFDFNNAAAVKGKTWSQLVDKVLNHYKKSTPNVILEQEMLQRKQGVGESIADYYDEINRLVGFTSIADNSKDAKEEVARMLLFGGIRSDGFRQEILKQPKQLNAEEQLDLLIRLERAQKGSGQASTPAVVNNAESEVNALSTYRQQKTGGQQRGRGGHGDRGGTSTTKFSSREEFIKQAICRSCKKVGHLAATCPSKEKGAFQVEATVHNNNAEVHSVETRTDPYDEGEREDAVSDLRYAEVKQHSGQEQAHPGQ